MFFKENQNLIFLIFHFYDLSNSFSDHNKNQVRMFDRLFDLWAFLNGVLSIFVSKRPIQLKDKNMQIYRMRILMKTQGRNI